MNLKEQLQEDIISYFDQDLEYEDKETIVNDLCYIIVDRITEVENNG
jgi:hypothetical protein